VREVGIVTNQAVLMAIGIDCESPFLVEELPGSDEGRHLPAAAAIAGPHLFQRTGRSQRSCS
jgi:hypothetical protein